MLIVDLVQEEKRRREESEECASVRGAQINASLSRTTPDQQKIYSNTPDPDRQFALTVSLNTWAPS